MRYRNEDAIDRAEISSPRNFLLVTSAAVGERTESERREDENDRARVPIIERAKCICRLGVSSARGVFANVRTLRNFVLLLKGETLQLKSREKRSLRFGRFSLSNLFFFFREFASPEEERERECWLCALIKEKKRGAEVDRSRTERESERRYDK